MRTQSQTPAKAQRTTFVTPAWTGLLQRKCACGGSRGECEDCQKKKSRLKVAQHTTLDPELSEVSPSVDEVLCSTGQPLEAGTRAFMEQRFGHDFSQVRIRADSKAAYSARTVGALAYTVGRDVVFREHQYAPHWHAGRRLIAHELAHVVQQQMSGSVVQQQAAISQPDDAAELQAERVADQVVRGEPVGYIAPLSYTLVQRDNDLNTDKQADEPAEKPLSRDDETQLSRTSPGQVGGSVQPPVISIYNFAIDSANLKIEHKAALTEVADLIKQTDTSKVGVIVIGHADSTGSPRVNLPLSRRRAQAVRELLASKTGRSIAAEWAGDTQPADANDSVDGRSRNRRVDIHFRPLGGARPSLEPPPKTERPPAEKDQPPPTQPPPKQDEPPRREDEPKDDKWFCAKYPLLCAGIGVGVGVGVGALFCFLNPLKCLPTPRIPGGDPPKAPEDKDKRKRPCMDSRSLPSGTIKAQAIGPFFFGEFKMSIIFRNDDTGCVCALGEYKQEVRGFAERDGGTGVMRPAPPLGLKLDRSKWQEDLRGGVARYGVRDEPIGNTDKDEFLPDRDTGCRYRGADSPGMQSIAEGEHVRFHFEFRGGAVDRRLRSVPIGAWSDWVVEGDYTRPKPPPKTPTPTPTPAPTPQQQLPLPTPEVQGPTIGPSSGPPPAPSDFCMGGTIACKTLDFLQNQRRDHTFLTKDDANQAVVIEFEALKKNRIPPPFLPPHGGEEYFAWIQALRLEARNRVRAFLSPYFAPLPD
jgi:outer membrane protein OmpA-like peptidoglycan-associated protein